LCSHSSFAFFKHPSFSDTFSCQLPTVSYPRMSVIWYALGIKASCRLFLKTFPCRFHSRYFITEFSQIPMGLAPNFYS